MSSLKSISSKLSLLILGVGGVSSIPTFVGSATPQSESFHSDAIKQEKKKVFDKNQRFQGGGCHYWVTEDNIKQRLGEIKYEKLKNSDAKVTSGGKTFWVVYSVGPDVAACYVAGKTVSYNLEIKSADRADFLLSSLNLKNGKRNKDTVVMHLSIDKNNTNKWSAVQENGWAGTGPFWKGDTTTDLGKNGWYPTHAALCIPQDNGDTNLVQEKQTINGGYNPVNGKCQLNAVSTSDMISAEKAGAHLKESTIIGQTKEGKGRGRKWAQKWWDDLTWLELK